MLADRHGQPPRQLDREHRARLGHRHPPSRPGLVHIPAGLPGRAAQPARQHAGRLGRRHARVQQVSGRVDPRRVLSATGATVTSHDINIQPLMSGYRRDTPGHPVIALTGPARPPATARSTTRRSAPCWHPTPPASSGSADPRHPARSRPAHRQDLRLHGPGHTPRRRHLHRPRGHPPGSRLPGHHRPRSSRR